ncbi:MAG: hypothetical protein CMN01_02160 [Rickettsiales bacterium]|nr:hypothetical protein [Rickettsiales bacterium]|tara:strand:+ start:313 stop:690 length:378 start_codon:yes stop_codon:yes gene_type:complete
MTKIIQKNVLDRKLELCSNNPLTGFFRDGCCRSSLGDSGEHYVCASVTKEFLNFSFKKGNNLISPRPELNFPGLKEGDRWCICTDRWIEAFKNSCAPKIILSATNIIVKKKINLEILKKFALDIN